MTPIQRWRRHVLDVSRKDHRFQFGQQRGHNLIPEGNACGANVIQRIVNIYNGERVSMDRVVRAAGADPDELRHRGLYTSEMMRALQRLVPQALYTAASGTLTYEQASDLARTNGPVIFIARYGEWPEWQGYQYRGVKADGKPNGYAKPIGAAGKTQLTGFDNGAHYGLLLSSGQFPRWTKHWVHDSNHNSVVRPEEPLWDEMNMTQWAHLFTSGADVTRSRRTWAAYPTAKLGG